MKYTYLKNVPMLSPQKQSSKFKSSEYKGRKIIGGKKYTLWNTADTKAEANRIADSKRREGWNARITKSRYYADYNIWIAR